MLKLTRRVAVATIASLLLIRPAAAQSGWFWQNPLPQGNDLLVPRHNPTTSEEFRA